MRSVELITIVSGAIAIIGFIGRELNLYGPLITYVYIFIAILVVSEVFMFFYIKSLDVNGLKLSNYFKRSKKSRNKKPSKRFVISQELIFIIIALFIAGLYLWQISVMFSEIQSLPNYNGQFINFGSSSNLALTTNCTYNLNYQSETIPSSIVAGNSLGGNISAIFVGHRCQIYAININLQFSIYPGVKTAEFYFLPQQLPNISTTRYVLHEETMFGFDNISLDSINPVNSSETYFYKNYGNVTKGTAIFKNLRSGTYNLYLDIVTNKSSAFPPFNDSINYLVYTLSGELLPTQNFLTGFKIYSYGYANKTSACQANPNLCSLTIG